jgi:ADP-ribose pyrophosphatase YjhB (NUDIX family)
MSVERRPGGEAVGDDPCSFVAQARCIAEERASWPGGIELSVRGYLSPVPPPHALVTSSRAVVFRNTEVLVFFDGAAPHVLPGGRLEPEESPDDAVRRELLEETGWSVGPLTLLGCVHLRHLTPRPAGHAYPYPEFLQTVFMAEANDYDPASLVPDEWVQHSGFITLTEVMALPLRPVERAFLQAARTERDRAVRQEGTVHGR